MATHLLIANPAAGRGRCRGSIAETRRLLSGASIACDFYETEGPGDARRVARREAERYAVVVALGGDGTFHEVAGGLAEARLAAPVPAGGSFAQLAILPGGTGNDLVKAVGLPGDIAGSFERLRAGRTRELDLGRIRWRNQDDPAPRERIFANNVGLGFEGQVGYAAREIRLPIRGTFLYFLGLLKVLRRLVNPPLRVRFGGGETIEGAKLLLSVGNGHSSGGGFILNPEADPFDGALDFCVVDARRRLEILRLLPRVMKGTHLELPGVQSRRNTLAEIDGGLPFHGHVDGELLGDRITWVHVEILPALLPVIC